MNLLFLSDTTEDLIRFSIPLKDLLKLYFFNSQIATAKLKHIAS